MLRSPQRVYSPEALEAWFSRLAEPWESAFTPEVLEEGRNWYRQGEVRGLELTKDTAIVSTKRERQELYAVVEWVDDRPSVRASIKERLLSQALAVAGLYEIEELIADEISPLPGWDEKTAAPTPKPASADNGQAAEAPKRLLRVHLSSLPEGLRLQAFWQNGEASTESAFRSRQLPKGEREDLIRLTTRARHAYFEARSQEGDYLLTDPVRATRFVRTELPRWRRLFQLQVDPAVTHLERGVQNLKARLELAEADEGRLHFRWRLAAGAEWLTEAETATVLGARGGVAYLSRRGAVQLPEDIRSLRQQWDQALGQAEGEVPRYLLFALQGQETVPLALSAVLERWRQELEAEAPAPQLDLPDLLRPYQSAGVAWLDHVLRHGGHALLADEMGLGKTLQVLSLLHARWQDSEEPSLIVCPASVVPVWEAEAARFFPGLPVRRLENGRHPGQEPGRLLWVSSYAQVRRQTEHLREVPLAVAVLDEAQFIKNPEAKSARACYGLRARHRLALTGTPVENHQRDLWSVFQFLMPGLLGNRSYFEEALETDAEGATRRLRRQITPFFLRRTKAAVLPQLPPKLEIVQRCPLSQRQQQEYVQWAAHVQETFGGSSQVRRREEAINLFAALTRLRQICCDPGLLPWLDNVPPTDSGKLQVLVARLADVVASGAKAVVFSQFVKLLHRARGEIERALPGVPLFELTGRTLDRGQPVEGFQKTKGPALMLVSLRAGGTGLTLHAAEYVFLLDPWWNPAVEAQAVDRVHRFGQDKCVTVYRLITAGTIEERIESLKDKKRDLFRSLVGDLGDSADLQARFRSLQDLIALRDTEALDDSAEAENGE